MSARLPFADAFQTRIYCTRCRETRGALKGRGENGWINRCSQCGAVYTAPPPADPGRALTRKARRIQGRLERAGQLRLFPHPITAARKGD